MKRESWIEQRKATTEGRIDSAERRIKKLQKWIEPIDNFYRQIAEKTSAILDERKWLG
jgi:hypothetical protein